MDRETFERLVSEWLDEPERDELQAAIEAAVAETPTLCRLRDEWLRLDRLVRRGLPAVEGVDWPRLRRRIDERLGPTFSDAGLDERLRDLTAVAHRVDWSRLRKRISQAVADAGGKPGVIRFPLRRVGVGLAIAAAAAAVILMLTPPTRAPFAPAGFAQVRVSSATRAPGLQERGGAFARVIVTAPPGAEDTTDVTKPLRPGSGEPQLVEVFLMVEPAQAVGAPGGRPFPFGLN